MSQMIRGELANPSTRPYAKQLRADLHAVLFSVEGAVSDEESQRQAFIEREGSTRQVYREGWEEVLT